MMKNFKFIVFVFCCTACSKKIIVNSKNTQSIYVFSLPKKATIKKLQSDDPNTEWVANLGCEKKIFVSTNEKDGSNINKYKYQEFGQDISLKILISDSLELSGKNEKGHWKEIKKNGLVYGYINIPLAEKDFYDTLIIPLAKKKK